MKPRRVTSRTRARLRAERRIAQEVQKAARKAKVKHSEKVRKALSESRRAELHAAGVFRKDPHFHDCPYCRTPSIGERHLERCCAKAKKPILEAKARGITILDYVAESEEEDEE